MTPKRIPTMARTGRICKSPPCDPRLDLAHIQNSLVTGQQHTLIAHSTNRLNDCSHSIIRSAKEKEKKKQQLSTNAFRVLFNHDDKIIQNDVISIRGPISFAHFHSCQLKQQHRSGSIRPHSQRFSISLTYCRSPAPHMKQSSHYDLSYTAYLQENPRFFDIIAPHPPPYNSLISSTSSLPRSKGI